MNGSAPTRRPVIEPSNAKRSPPPAPQPPFDAPEPTSHHDVTWLQPNRNETIRLAFITALQRLPPRQTAVILLCDVLDFSQPEAADEPELAAHFAADDIDTLLTDDAWLAMPPAPLSTRARRRSARSCAQALPSAAGGTHQSRSSCTDSPRSTWETTGSSC